MIRVETGDINLFDHSTSTTSSMLIAKQLASSPFKSPPQRRRADFRRPFHHDKSRPLLMLDKPLGDYLRHDLIGVVNALAALEAQRESERLSQIERSAGVRLSAG